MSQMSVKLFYHGVLLISGHYLLMVREGVSPTPNSVISAKTSDYVTTMMLERVCPFFDG